MKRLLDLAFGNAGAPLIGDSTVATEALAQFLPSIHHIGAAKSGDFLTRQAARRFGSIGMLAPATLPGRMEVLDSGGWHLAIPCRGHTEIRFERDAVLLSPGRNALLMPNLKRMADNAARSNVYIGLNIDRLRRTITTVSGLGGRRQDIGDTPIEIRMNEVAGLFPAFQRICALIDTLHPAIGDPLGIEDLVYRWIALGSCSEDAELQTDCRPGHGVDVVCDAILAHPEHRMTLTEMEAMSDLSARALQYAFRSRFGCSPMEWQRRTRMQNARDRLLAALPHESITTIAYDMGFSSSSAFAAQYKARFGESPSETRSRAGLPAISTAQI